MMIPWGQIIAASVTMADVAHSLYKKTKKDDAGKGSAQALEERITQLESIQSEQSALLQQMTAQNKVLIRKVRNAYIMTAAALFLAVLVTIVYAFNIKL
jgi:hypothetical protein